MAGINAAGAVTIDTNDSTGNTSWVGTGETNICGSGRVAGVGLYKSTDGGATWAFIHNGAADVTACTGRPAHRRSPT